MESERRVSKAHSGHHRRRLPLRPRRKGETQCRLYRKHPLTVCVSLSFFLLCTISPLHTTVFSHSFCPSPFVFPPFPLFPSHSSGFFSFPCPSSSYLPFLLFPSQLSAPPFSLSPLTFHAPPFHLHPTLISKYLLHTRRHTPSTHIITPTTPTPTHPHFHTLNPTHPHSHTLSLSHTLTLTHPHSHTLSLPYAHSHTLPHTLTPTLTTQLGGIVDLPDGQCHLDPVSRQYNFDARQDYPSSAYIATILNERRIIPIFSVAVSVERMYQNLVNTIRSAFVGTFNPMSQELLELIERQYQVKSVNHIDNNVMF